ncbi:MAG: hypothetical protein JWM05_1869, partial [Acidimicrobiales bacterium]|nr:hypothetical protein [Acidimicrobiales bacterium]
AVAQRGGGPIAAGRRTVALPAGRSPLAVRPGDQVDVWATFDPSLAPHGLGPTRLVTAGATVVTASREVVTVAVADADTRAVANAAAVGTITLAGAPAG